ncbi:hypothetical protein ACJX0J_040058 [Zea mays]
MDLILRSLLLLGRKHYYSRLGPTYDHVIESIQLINCKKKETILLTRLDGWIHRQLRRHTFKEEINVIVLWLGTSIYNTRIHHNIIGLDQKPLEDPLIIWKG